MYKQQGVTLIELIIALVLLSAIAVIMLQAATGINRSSVDPLMRTQALNIASAHCRN